MIQRFDTQGRYAQAVRTGDLVFLAGQVADDAGADFQLQCAQVFARVDRLLGEAGSSRSSLLQMQVWLKDLQHYAAFNALYDAWIDPANKPVRATVQAELVAPGYLVELMVSARCEQGAAS